MDREFPEGSFVTCVDWWEAGLQMKAGQVLHVERKRAGGQLVEITIKVLEKRDGVWWLAPNSSLLHVFGGWASRLPPQDIAHKTLAEARLL